MRRWLTYFAYGALLLGALASGVGLYGLLRDVVDESGAFRADSRDDLVWYVNQYRFELLALIAAIDQHRHGWDGVTRDDVRERLDVFWSRLDGAGQGAMGERLYRLDDAKPLVRDARTVLERIEPQLSEASTTHRALDEMMRSLYELRPRFRALAFAALEFRHGRRAAYAHGVEARTRQIGTLSFGMALCAIGLMVLLLFERHRITQMRAALQHKFDHSTQALRESEQRFRRLAESAPEAVLVLDLESGLFVDANENAAKMFGRSVNELVGAGPLDLCPEHQPDGARSEQIGREYVEQAIRGDVPSFEWTCVRADGAELPCEVRLVAMPWGDSVHVRGSLIDISERRRTENELAVYREQLEALVEERSQELVVTQRELIRSERLATIGELTGTVSHELRNPLGTISTSFSLLKARLDTGDERTQRTLERIERNIFRCVKIIDELLDFARIRELSPVPTKVDPWLDGVVAELQPPDGVVLASSLRSGASVNMDPDRLRQVVVNLAENAFHASLEAARDDTPCRVDVSTERVGDLVEIRVADSGVGVRPQDREAIFEPLFSTRSFGIGLGLPLVRRIVEQHDGRIEVRDAPSGGALFVVSLACEVATSVSRRSTAA